MTAEDRCPVVHFDHNSAEHAADPVGSYCALRSQSPVAYTEAHGGYWVLTGYQAVFEAARDDDVFSSARSGDGGEGLTVTIPKTPMHHHIPIEIDPPDFRKYRKILNAITSPAAIVDLIPRIQHHRRRGRVDEPGAMGSARMGADPFGPRVRERFPDLVSAGRLGRAGGGQVGPDPRAAGRVLGRVAPPGRGGPRGRGLPRRDVPVGGLARDETIRPGDNHAPRYVNRSAP